jgi:hypothetical protein
VTRPGGRIAAAFVMLEGVALLTITIAVITSTFVTRAAREREDALAAGDDRVRRGSRPNSTTLLYHWSGSKPSSERHRKAEPRPSSKRHPADSRTQPTTRF